MSWGAVAMAGAGLVGGMMSGKKSGSTTTTNEPWAGQQPYLTDLYSRAGAQSNQPFYSPTTTGLQNQYLSGSQNLASGGTSPLFNQASGELSKTLAGGYSNPFAGSMMTDAANMARSSINSQFQGDNFGNSSHQERLGRGITNAIMPYASQMHENERNRQMGAAQLAPVFGSQEFNQDLARVGQLGQATQASAGFDQAPWDALQRYQSLISGGGYGQTTQPYYTNQGANALGMGLGGLALYNQLGGGSAAGGSSGGGVEAANLMGMFSGQNLGQPDFGGGFY